MLAGDTRIVAVRSKVITCFSCKAWLGRVPTYCGDGDKGDYCHRCGCTSVNIRDGRPFGPRSRDWSLAIDEVMDLLRTFATEPVFTYELEEILEAVVVREVAT